MIFKRAVAKLRAQDWAAISIELVIVIVGVFLGTWVANWNQEREQKRETERMLVQLHPSLQSMTEFFASARTYFGTTRRYATTAFAGWRGDPSISDREFVSAAYQASQIQGIGTNNSTLATVLGADQMRRIDDLAIRNDLSFLISADYSALDVPAVNTPYRQNVRRVIPAEVQDAIRAQCGDYTLPNKPLQNYLPPTCDLKITPEQAAAAAAALRAHPELVQDLRWHVAAQATLLQNIAPFESIVQDLERRIADQSG